jgi:hypothetical protein
MLTKKSIIYFLAYVGTLSSTFFDIIFLLLLVVNLTRAPALLDCCDLSCRQMLNIPPARINSSLKQPLSFQFLQHIFPASDHLLQLNRQYADKAEFSSL